MAELVEIKEEFKEVNGTELDQSDDDYVVGTYDISVINSQRKVFCVAGLTPVMDSSKKFDVSIRTDFKSMKLSSDLNHTKYVAYTKDTNMLLDHNSFAVKLSQDTGKAYFVVINALQIASFVEEQNRATKPIDDQNDIVQDVAELPNPTRNKFNQLEIIMKNHLYKSLKVVPNGQQRNFLNTLFNTPYKSNMKLEDVKIKPIQVEEKPKIDANTCDYSRLQKVNFLDIKRIEPEETRVEAFMRKAQVLSFYEIQMLLKIDELKLLNCLQTFAHLVRGIWVIKSHLLYKKNEYHTDSRKKNLDDLICAREFLLHVFVTNKKLRFSDVYPRFKQSKDHEEILHRLTVRRGTNEFLDFLLPEDSYFLMHYPDIAPKHASKTEVALARYQNYLAS